MRILFLILIITLANACAPITSKHGFNNIEAMRRWVDENTVLQHEITSRFGPASFVDHQESVTSLYYVSFTKERFAFFKPEITQRDILVLHFDKGAFKEFAEYRLEDGKEVKLVSDITPIYGKQLNVIQQILSNVGRFNNVPGQSRGGRSDGSVLGRIPGGI